MAIRPKHLAVSIPDTVLEEKASPREKTVKLGIIARACAIYGVETIEVFRDPHGRSEGGFIRRVLEYLETPQYLRRRLYPLDESLKFAGVLPPLRIPSHQPKVPASSLSVGETREGVAIGDGTADIGLDAAPTVRGAVPAGSRATFRIVSVRPLQVEPIERADAGYYWGYTVETPTPGEVVEDGRYEVKVATSRLGTPLGDALEPLKLAVRQATGVKLVFGSPARGLFDIIGDQMARFQFVVNLYPTQYVQTVRTEEAVFAGLGLVSTLSAGKA